MKEWLNNERKYVKKIAKYLHKAKDDGGDGTTQNKLVETPSTRPASKELFPMSLAGKIHELCNGVQFMKVEAAVLLDAFNNPRPNMIKVCSGEKYRVQHLLYQVKMYLDNNNQPKELFEPICNAFGIKASDCVRRKNLENDHWGKNKDFIKEVKAIFEDEF